MKNFSNSTEIGKLYINYPMVESFKDICDLDDDSFLTSTVQYEDIQRGPNGKNKYKKLVNTRSCIPSDILAIDKVVGKKMIDLHNKKQTTIIGEGISIEEKYSILCEQQCDQLERENKIWIINTSLIHFLDEYGEMKA